MFRVFEFLISVLQNFYLNQENRNAETRDSFLTILEEQKIDSLLRFLQKQNKDPIFGSESETSFKYDETIKFFYRRITDDMERVCSQHEESIREISGSEECKLYPFDIYYRSKKKWCIRHAQKAWTNYYFNKSKLSKEKPSQLFDFFYLHFLSSNVINNLLNGFSGTETPINTIFSAITNVLKHVQHYDLDIRHVDVILNDSLNCFINVMKENKGLFTNIRFLYQFLNRMIPMDCILNGLVSIDKPHYAGKSLKITPTHFLPFYGIKKIFQINKVDRKDSSEIVLGSHLYFIKDRKKTIPNQLPDKLKIGEKSYELMGAQVLNDEHPELWVRHDVLLFNSIVWQNMRDFAFSTDILEMLLRDRSRMVDSTIILFYEYNHFE